MKFDSQTDRPATVWLPLILLALPAIGAAQVPVDEDGQPIGEYEAVVSTTDDGLDDDSIPLLSAAELDELVGPIALYPDDLLAIVLPASTYPLQVIQAARFLEDLEDNPSLKPDEAWDDSVVALVNYPEVVELLNDDLDWTWRLGEAVVAQQATVIDAIESFRDRAYAAGNLKSDERQTVVRNDDVIEITPVDDDVIYVPYYEPERVVVYQPRPVYYYYPRAYPVYYYPYPSYHSFNRGYFWGVTTAFTVGWYTDRLHVHHHSYHGHPYYGRHYYNNWWYRRPSINIHYNYYGHKYKKHYNRYRHGDYWRPQTRRTINSNHRVTRTRYYPGADGRRDRGDANRRNTANNALPAQRPGNTPKLRRSRNDDPSTRRSASRGETSRKSTSRGETSRRSTAKREQRNPIEFRDRDSNRRSESSKRSSSNRPSSKRRPEIQFRDRNETAVSRKAPSTSKRQATPRTSSKRQSTERTPSVRSSQTRKKVFRESPTRQSSAYRNATRKSATRQSPTRKSASRQSPTRQSFVRQSEPRQSSARSSQSRKPSVRSSQSRQPSVRSSAPRHSGQRQSKPRQSAPKVSKSGSSSSKKVASSQRRKSERRSSTRR
ncbi:MAG: DUF3300 domain-containing protein [Gammaproteobacteria bacterium]|nr:DUF3300 domain-containing protein [Gammaproteobacteria bacterium]